jgi:hypothetical protein
MTCLVLLTIYIYSRFSSDKTDDSTPGIRKVILGDSNLVASDPSARLQEVDIEETHLAPFIGSTADEHKSIRIVHGNLS